MRAAALLPRSLFLLSPRETLVAAVLRLVRWLASLCVVSTREAAKRASVAVARRVGGGARANGGDGAGSGSGAGGRRASAVVAPNTSLPWATQRALFDARKAAGEQFVSSYNLVENPEYSHMFGLEGRHFNERRHACFGQAILLEGDDGE